MSQAGGSDNTLLFVGVVTAIVGVVSAIVFLRRGNGGGADDDGSGMSASGRSSSTDSNADGGPGGSKKEAPAGSLDIFFGSQTGTSEGMARIIAEEGKRRGFDPHVIDLEDFEPEQLLNCKRALFLMATYGEGEPTDNAASFLEWLSNKEGDSEGLEGENALAELQFTVFGLGNKQYEHYNRMGRLTNELLLKHGGQHMFRYGEGDDDAVLEEDFEAWTEELWPELVRQFHPDSDSAGDAGQNAADGELPELQRLVRYLDGDGLHEENGERPRSLSDAACNPSTKFYFTSVEVPVVVNRELRTPRDDGSTRHIELDISSAAIEYLTADNLAVLPENRASVVKAVADALGFDTNRTFVQEPVGDNKVTFPTPCSVRDALTRYCDLTSVPRRSTVAGFIPFVTDPAERKRLQAMCSKEGRQEFKRVVEDGCLSLADIVTREFTSIRIPLEHFLRVVPHLQPRYYTISSSSSVYPDSIHITVAVIHERLPNGRTHKGVASYYLRELLPDGVSDEEIAHGLDDMPHGRTSSRTRSISEVAFDMGAHGPTCRIFIRPSAFRLPAQPSTPIIMIGPGTGIAPMRALMQERQFQRDEGMGDGDNILFFGCRRRDSDFIYSDELTAAKENGLLTDLQLAFSRENEHKVYVQHLMKEQSQAEALWNLIDQQNAYIYVCGGTQMGHDVMQAIVEVFETHGMWAERAVERVKEMQAAGRYVQELWS